ncbi:hypothetical protein FK220_010580 [Flavobacteriaceae bacterium TP-CH-4]|uniref:Transmembrane family 220 protein n=1 Tax=Pelagihabitans pacificus TaxID=2696054 RepID=A0A967B0A9_9FLAO|nr:transmembrane 220 family protein [Pelagihabitans pacificus]NHF59786.1 hypothetical protein [Pelagihabitans pacificus]
MNLFFKVFAWLFGVLCVVSAILQYNDPDPFLWIVIYGLAAILCFGFALQKIPFWLPLFAGVLFILGFFYVFPEEFVGFGIDSGDIKNVEEGRESFGLLILALVMFSFSIWSWYRNRLKV